jgi:hypothetical protein
MNYARTGTLRCPQAVSECGRDEVSEKSAAYQLWITTQARVCFCKILQRDLPHAAAHYAKAVLFKTPRQPKSIKKSSFINEIGL